MKTCRDCVYFLAHRVSGYNCGYLIKRVGSCNVICRHFNDAGSCHIIESREELTFQEEGHFVSGGERYAKEIGRTSRTSFHPHVFWSGLLGSRFGRIKELLDRYLDSSNRKTHVWFRGILEGRKKNSEPRHRRERRN